MPEIDNRNFIMAQKNVVVIGYAPFAWHYHAALPSNESTDLTQLQCWSRRPDNGVPLV